MSEELPAWSLSAEAVESIALPEEWPGQITREWAWGGATGAGARVCVLDSGIETDHPLVGDVQKSVAISIEGEEVIIEDGTQSHAVRLLEGAVPAALQPLLRRLQQAAREALAARVAQRH